MFCCIFHSFSFVVPPNKTARVNSISSDRFTMEHCVVSHSHAKVAAEGEGIIVSYDYRVAAKAPHPDHIRRVLEHIERGS